MYMLTIFKYINKLYMINVTFYAQAYVYKNDFLRHLSCKLVNKKKKKKHFSWIIRIEDTSTWMIHENKIVTEIRVT